MHNSDIFLIIQWWVPPPQPLPQAPQPPLQPQYVAMQPNAIFAPVSYSVGYHLGPLAMPMMYMQPAPTPHPHPQPNLALPAKSSDRI